MNLKGFYIYFYFDENNTLLYVGLSNDVGRRFYGHREEWMSEVKKIGVRQYQDKASMQLCERYYIAKLNPKYNIKNVVEGSIDISLSDPTKMDVMSINEFIKYRTTERVKKKKLAFKEKLINSNCTMISSDAVNLFEESILSLNLDKTVFLCENYIFYFKGDILNDQNKDQLPPITNSKIQHIKGFLNKNKKHSDDIMMPFILYFQSTTTKLTGGHAIISSVSGNKERIVTNITFSDSSFISFSENHLIIHFGRFIMNHLK